MRRLRTRKRAVSRTVSLPSPVGGLNARDSVALMPETDAITLDNWFPQQTSVGVRNGYEEHATFTGQAEAVFAYTAATTKVFVGVKDGSTYTVYDATAGGALSTAAVGGSGPAVQALTSCQFDTINVGTTGGQYLLACNGADNMLQFDGSSWSVASGITGVTGGNDEIASIALYAERVWLMQKNTFDVWYLGVGAVAGAATKINLGSLFKLGGTLNCMVTWSADSASDTADYIAFISTEGEVNVYTGTDPASAATWARVSHFRIGRPVTRGNRCWAKLGADAVVLCTDGVVPLAKAAMLGRASTEWAVTDKIRPLVNRDIIAYGTNTGWGVIVHPSGSKLIVNIPSAERSSSHQYVMNTQTQAWCRFTGWDAFAWEVTKDVLYFGGNGVLVIADTGALDGTDAISFDAAQAYSYFKSRGQNKLFTMMRPIFELDGPVTLQLGVNVDFNGAAPSSVLTLEGSAGDPWSVAWSAAWGGATTIYRGWQSVQGIGFAAAPRVIGNVDETRLAWAATDIVFEPAGVL